MFSSFAPGRTPRADDSGSDISFHMDHDDQRAIARVSNRHEPLFLDRVPRVQDRASQCIPEDGGRLIERDAVFRQIVRGFFCIPLELHDPS